MDSTQRTVKDVMSRDVQYIAADTTLEQAARTMRELGCGFLPIGDTPGEKLQGVITDRDIATRAVAERLDPSSTPVTAVQSDRVLYCFEGDQLEQAAKSMHDQQVYRLVVLDNADSKKLAGVISLNDIVRHNERQLASAAAEGIAA